MKTKFLFFSISHFTHLSQIYLKISPSLNKHMNHQTTAGKNLLNSDFIYLTDHPWEPNPTLLHEIHHSVCSTSCPFQLIIPNNLVL